MSAQPTVFVIDDDDGVRDSLRYLIESAGWPVQAYDSAESFLRAVPPTTSGCAVLDVRMPGMSGLELQKRLRDSGCHLPLILITAYGDVRSAVRAMKLGAVDFIEKPVNDDALIQHIRTAIELDVKKRDAHTRRARLDECLAKLSRREREVYELVITGKSSKQIAEDLDLSPKTIESHRAHIMEKMGVSSVWQLIHMSLSAPEAET